MFQLGVTPWNGVLATFGEGTLGRETQPLMKPLLRTAANAIFTESG